MRRSDNELLSDAVRSILAQRENWLTPAARRGCPPLLNQSGRFDIATEFELSQGSTSRVQPSRSASERSMQPTARTNEILIAREKRSFRFRLKQ